MKSKGAWPRQNIFIRDTSPPNGRIKRIQAGRALDSAAIDRYMRHGWVAVPGFFSAARIADIQRFTEETLALPEISGAQMVYRETSLLDPNARVIQRIEDLCPHHKGFDRLIRGGRLQRCVERLLGEPAVLFKEKINFKMPGGAGFEAHQDQQAGWSAYAPLFVTALVTLDAATLENGCLEVSAGRHREGLIGEQWKALEEQGLNLQPVPTAPGDVIFFDSFVPHASKPTLTDSPRRILYITYNLASEGDHRERYFADKHASFPPDIDRDREKTYVFRV